MDLLAGEIGGYIFYYYKSYHIATFPTVVSAALISSFLSTIGQRFSGSIDGRDSQTCFVRAPSGV